MDEAARQARAWDHVVRGYEQALREMRPDDELIELMRRCLRTARQASGQPPVVCLEPPDSAALFVHDRESLMSSPNRASEWSRWCAS
jgi:hypothetical protein